MADLLLKSRGLLLMSINGPLVRLLVSRAVRIREDDDDDDDGTGKGRDVSGSDALQPAEGRSDCRRKPHRRVREDILPR